MSSFSAAVECDSVVALEVVVDEVTPFPTASTPIEVEGAITNIFIINLCVARNAWVLETMCRLVVVGCGRLREITIVLVFVVV